MGVGEDIEFGVFENLSTACRWIMGIVWAGSELFSAIYVMNLKELIVMIVTVDIFVLVWTWLQFLSGSFYKSSECNYSFFVCWSIKKFFFSPALTLSFFVLLSFQEFPLPL